MTRLLAAHLPHRGLLRLEGEDCQSFLQGLISNDIGKLTSDHALYAALLTPQGKYLFDFLLFSDGGAILIESEGARLAQLMQRLLMYRLRAHVEISDITSANRIAVVLGEEAPEAFGLPHAPGAARAEDGLVIAVDPRVAALGVRLVGASGAVDAALAARDVEISDSSAYDEERVRLGVPEGAVDLIVQKSTLLESNFEELHGVDFDKGCYVGQELTARTKYRGLVKKRLVPVTVEGVVRSGDPVSRDGKEVGDIRSVAGGRALALIRLEALDGSPLESGEAVLRPEPLAWLAPGR